MYLLTIGVYVRKRAVDTDFDKQYILPELYKLIRELGLMD